MACCHSSTLGFNMDASHKIFTICMVALLTFVCLQYEELRPSLAESSFASAAESVFSAADAFGLNRIQRILHNVVTELRQYDVVVGGASSVMQLANIDNTHVVHLSIQEATPEPQISAEQASAPAPSAEPAPTSSTTAHELTELAPASSTPTEQHPAAAEVPSAPQATPPVPSAPAVILLVGDSFMEQFDLTLKRYKNFSDVKNVVKFVSVARHSTGLSNALYYDWPKELENFIIKYHPNIVLYCLGANDLQSVVEHKRKTLFGTHEWKARYRERVEQMIEMAQHRSAYPIWIGLPVMAKKGFEKMPILVEVQREGCANRGAVYVDSNAVLADQEGKYRAYMRLSDGRTVRIRRDDKCHISDKGAVLVLDEVMPHIRDYLSQHGWLTAPRTYGQSHK